SRTVTLPEVLRSAGMYTALVADTPYPYFPENGYQRGFDHVHIVRGQERDPFARVALPVTLPCNAEKLRDGDWAVTQYLRNVAVARRKVEEDYFSARTLREAAAWLDKSHRRQPFFLFVDTFDPHEPWDPPKSYVDLYDPGYDGEEVIYPRYDRWRDFLSERELKHCRALYAGEASMVDRWVGHLLDRIERLGLLDNTLVCFISDHGTYLGEHGYIGKAILRDNQYESLPLYSEVCRLPWLLHFPGCSPGSKIDALVQPVNLAPTVLDFLGIQRPGTFAAPSLWHVLQGKESKASEIAISSPTLSGKEMTQPVPTNRCSITDGRWLLIYGCAGTDEPRDESACLESNQRLVAPLAGVELSPELYDLEADPGCNKNVITDHEDRARDLHRQFRGFLESSPMRREHLRFFQKI
ncbi:MAG TPA: sulfatase, partial [Gemmataceae bacterium]|nr:sulfatase [Gemmataceae bacterium]